MIEITGNASTTSRRPARMLTNMRVLRTFGNRIVLEDGQERVDWQMGLCGPIFGYSPPWLQEAMSKAVATSGGVASIAFREEQVVADLLQALYPVDGFALRWMCNGSDPCAGAVKLARALTGRDRILSCGYHGFNSCFCAPPGIGVPDMRRGTLTAEREAYVPLKWLEWPTQPLSDVAAVVVECPPVDGGREKAGEWLHRLAELAHDCGALFVLDEVVTGFRLTPSGAAGYYGIMDEVDMFCFGKSLGNGFPVSALLGRKEIMDELTHGVHWSATFFGSYYCLAAAKATLAALQREMPWAHLYEIGEQLKNGWNDLGLPWKMRGHPTRPILETPDYRRRVFSHDEDAGSLDDLRRHLFQQGHIIAEYPWYTSTAHIEQDVDSLLEAARSWER